MYFIFHYSQGSERAGQQDIMTIGSKGHHSTRYHDASRRNHVGDNGDRRPQDD